MLNMFRTLICTSSGACDYSVESPHWSYCSWFDVCWRFGVVGLEWYPCCRLKHNLLCFSLQHGYTHQTKNNTTIVAFQQNSRKLLMLDILMSKTCWAHKKWNKIASDIKLVFYSSTVTEIFRLYLEDVSYILIHIRTCICQCSLYAMGWMMGLIPSRHKDFTLKM